VSTSSTKSGSGNKGRRQNVESVGIGVSPSEDSASEGDIPKLAWRIGVVVTFLIAAVLRIYDLALVPMHHDEGVNGNFLVRLVREGYYQYDPANYHGPTIYYFTAAIPWTIKLLFGKAASETYGLNTVTIRLVPVAFGLATIWLIFLLRRQLGSVATLSAGLLLALSPGAIYLSRYYIHETLFVFFTLGIVVGVLRFYDQRNGLYLVLAIGSAAFLFATKETAMISVAVLIIALVCTFAYRRLMKMTDPGVDTRKTKNRKVTPTGYKAFINDFGGSTALAIWVGASVLVFIAINFLFYSSFLTNYPKGIYDAISTFNFWSKTGKEAHVHSAITYVSWLSKQELPLLLLGSFGGLLVVLKPKNALALFAGLWAFGLIAAYTLIPYKTPWLILNFIVPLALIAGYAIEWLYDLDRSKLGIPLAVLGLAACFSAYKAINLNFINYDNDNNSYVYVYAHTTRGLLKMVNEIDKIARETGEGTQIGISILSPDYWPLPWYFRNYTRVGYFGQMAPSTETLIIANTNQKAEIEANFGEVYRQVPSGDADGSFDLRPGVRLLLYERRDRVKQF